MKNKKIFLSFLFLFILISLNYAQSLFEDFENWYNLTSQCEVPIGWQPVWACFEEYGIKKLEIDNNTAVNVCSNFMGPEGPFPGVIKKNLDIVPSKIIAEVKCDSIDIYQSGTCIISVYGIENAFPGYYRIIGEWSTKEIMDDFEFIEFNVNVDSLDLLHDIVIQVRASVSGNAANTWGYSELTVSEIWAEYPIVNTKEDEEIDELTIINPVRDKIRIIRNVNSKKLEFIDLYSVKGEKLLQQQLFQYAIGDYYKIDVSSFSRGIYFLVYKYREDERIFTKKVVKY